MNDPISPEIYSLALRVGLLAEIGKVITAEDSQQTNIDHAYALFECIDFTSNEIANVQSIYIRKQMDSLQEQMQSKTLAKNQKPEDDEPLEDDDLSTEDEIIH